LPHGRQDPFFADQVKRTTPWALGAAHNTGLQQVPELLFGRLQAGQMQAVKLGGDWAACCLYGMLDVMCRRPLALFGGEEVLKLVLEL
jgi:hypothetical protein